MPAGYRLDAIFVCLALPPFALSLACRFARSAYLPPPSTRGRCSLHPTNQFGTCCSMYPTNQFETCCSRYPTNQFGTCCNRGNAAEALHSYTPATTHGKPPTCGRILTRRCRLYPLPICAPCPRCGFSWSVGPGRPSRWLCCARRALCHRRRGPGRTHAQQGDMEGCAGRGEQRRCRSLSSFDGRGCPGTVDRHAANGCVAGVRLPACSMHRFGLLACVDLGACMRADVHAFVHVNARLCVFVSVVCVPTCALCARL